jgi:uncharacterized protein
MGDKITRRSLLIGLVATTVPAVTPINLRISRQNHQLQSTPIINKASDRFVPTDPGAIQIKGFLGSRALKNQYGRLLPKREEEMLSCFQNRPGKERWIGQHAGKWLHAATLAWVSSKNEALRAKLDRVVAALIATQQEDGYLGTYSDSSHWGMREDQQWDVWVHKYDLLGLITYHTYTGETASLEAARKIGDLLVRTFGPGEQSAGKLDLNAISAQSGLASGSVLEPIVLLHRVTGDEKYLDFARYIVEHWEKDNGPKLVSSLTGNRGVYLTANGKAYEMLSCLVGLCELYRTTGELRYLYPAINAWQDIAANQILITGSGSSREYWSEPKRYYSESELNVAETCVTVSWIQLCQQLLRLTGDVRYAEELEKSYYNHLPAAQAPDGTAWAYFTALDGKKPYTTRQNCCSSSGPRGWSIFPTIATMADNDGVIVNFFTSGTATLNINGETVIVRQETAYPINGRVAITITVPKPMKFSLRVRVPSWSKIEGLKTKPGAYWLLRQTWSRTQTITLDFELPTRVVEGEGSNAGKVALVRGPQVLAVDEFYNSHLGSLSLVALANGQPQLKASAEFKDPDGLPVYETEGIITQDTEVYKAGERVTFRLVGFSSAGAQNREFAVWLKQLG